MENKIPIGLVKDFSSTNSAWEEVERQHLHINQVDFRGCITFADPAHHYAEHELVAPTESIHPKAHTTIRAYERVLRNRLLPHWGNRVALSVEPLEVEQWLKSLKGQEGLANPTLDRTRRVYVARLQARPTLRADSSKSGVEPDALRPLQDHQRVRSDDSHP